MADLSKLRLNGDEYYFKDAEIREAFGNAPGRLIPYGYCGTAAGTAAKIVTVSPAPVSLIEGLIIAVKFQYANTIANPTLNVNGLGAIAIKRYGTTAVGTSMETNWNANSVVILTYDGTYWQLTDFNNTFIVYGSMSDAEVAAGTGTIDRLITPARLKLGVTTWAPVKSVNGQTGDVTLTIPDADDHKWNDVSLNKGSNYVNTGECYIPYLDSWNHTVAYTGKATAIPTAKLFVKYDNNGYLNSTTPSANDNSTKVATTAYVDSAIAAITDANTTYTLSMSGNVITLTPSSGSAQSITLPVYNGGVS